ncbi:MAG: hypothetical protein ABI429_05840, partial [Jatrophihabitantaceae bacterium]
MPSDDQTSEQTPRESPARRRSGLPDPVRYAKRVTATARNAAEFVRFGGLHTGEQDSPYTVESEQFNYRLRHYFADAVRPDSPP